MFEDYLFDAADLFKIAKENIKINEKVCRRYSRLTIFCLFSSMESYVNYVAEVFMDKEIIDYKARLYLADKRIAFDKQKGMIESEEYHRLEEKIRLLDRIFSCGMKYNTKYWSDFKKLKSLRDSLIHSRREEDDTPINDYFESIDGGFESILTIVDTLSLGIFKKHIRKKILDLHQT